jgi:hypothetical protein
MHETPPVELEVPAEPKFSIEKLQRIVSSGEHTKSTLIGEVGQTVNYEIIVKNGVDEPLHNRRLCEEAGDNPESVELLVPLKLHEGPTARRATSSRRH